MNYELFIARRIIASKRNSGSISGPIIKIAVIAIALGMVIMLMTIATGTGLRKAIRDKVIGFSGHIQISNFDNNKSFEQNPIDPDPALQAELRAMSMVKNSVPFATKPGVLKTDQDFEGVILKGVGSKYDWHFFQHKLTVGSCPVILDSVTNDSVLISKSMASLLKLKLHDKIVLFFLKSASNRPLARPLYVAGIYDTGLEEFDEQYIIGDIAHVQKINGWEAGEVGGYEIHLHHYKDLKGAGEQVRFSVPYHLKVETVRQKSPQLFEWLDLFDTNIIIILIIMIAVAAINMVTALLVLILERTPMIGILKALGASGRGVRKVFIYQAVHLIFRGLLWGNGIGLGLALLQHYFGFIKLDQATYYVSEVPINLTIMHVLALNAGTLLICTAILIFPSYLISRISPIKTIQFD